MTVSETKAKIVARRMGIEMCVSRRLRSAISAATLRRARRMRHLLWIFVAARMIFTLLSFSSDSDNLGRPGPTTGPVTAEVVPSAAVVAAAAEVSSTFDCEVGGSSGGEGGGEGTDAGAIREEGVRKRQQGGCTVPWLFPALIWRIR